MWENPENQHVNEALNVYLSELNKLLTRIGMNPKIQGGILYKGSDNCDVDTCTGEHCDYCSANVDEYTMISDIPSIQKQVGSLGKSVEDNHVSGGGIYTRESGGFIEYLKYFSSVYGNIYIFIRVKYNPSEHKLLRENANIWGITSNMPTLANYIVLQYLSDVSLPSMPSMAPKYEEDQLMLLSGKHFLEDLMQDYISLKHNNFIGDLNIVSSLAYESQVNFGNIVLLHEDYLVHSTDKASWSNSTKNDISDLVRPRMIRLSILFAEPIAMSNHKRVRKLFEIATGDTYLIGDGVYIYGILTRKSLQDQAVDRYILVSIQGPLKWELYEIRSTQFKDKLLRVIYDSTGFRLKKKPTYKLDVSNKLGIMKQYVVKGMADVRHSPCYRCAYRNDCGTRTASEFENTNAVVNNIVNIIREAISQRHGTTIVFSRYAKQEVQRLKKTCFQIEDVQLTPDNGLIKPITAIDGAVMCDFDGVCHAIGVILDGMTIGGSQEGSAQGAIESKKLEEDISRGARYNSAIRYKNANPCSIICIVSEDGDVNII